MISFSSDFQSGKRGSIPLGSAKFSSITYTFWAESRLVIGFGYFQLPRRRRSAMRSTLGSAQKLKWCLACPNDAGLALTRSTTRRFELLSFQAPMVVRSSQCIALGRTGVGKDALLLHFEETLENTSRIDPQDVAFVYSTRTRRDPLSLARRE